MYIPFSWATQVNSLLCSPALLLLISSPPAVLGLDVWARDWRLSSDQVGCQEREVADLTSRCWTLVEVPTAVVDWGTMIVIFRLGAGWLSAGGKIGATINNHPDHYKCTIYYIIYYYYTVLSTITISYTVLSTITISYTVQSTITISYTVLSTITSYA